MDNMDEIRKRDIVEYQKNITADNPDVYAEVVLKFEGMEESRTEELRKVFNRFYKEVKSIVYAEVNSHAADSEGQPQIRKMLEYKDGRPSYVEQEI